MSNKVIETLATILDQAHNTNVIVGARSFQLSDPEIPIKAALTFVRSQLNALVPAKVKVNQ